MLLVWGRQRAQRYAGRGGVLTQSPWTFLCLIRPRGCLRAAQAPACRVHDKHTSTRPTSVAVDRSPSSGSRHDVFGRARSGDSVPRRSDAQGLRGVGGSRIRRRLVRCVLAGRSCVCCCAACYALAGGVRRRSQVRPGGSPRAGDPRRQSPHVRSDSTLPVGRWVCGEGPAACSGDSDSPAASTHRQGVICARLNARPRFRLVLRRDAHRKILTVDRERPGWLEPVRSLRVVHEPDPPSRPFPSRLANAASLDSCTSIISARRTILAMRAT